VSALHDDLMSTVASWNLALDEPLKRDTELISSGILDSLGLFQLLMWIEGKVGHPIDATTVDMLVVWNTVDAVVAYIEQEQAGR